MSPEYDEVRPDVVESSDRILKGVQKMDDPTAKIVSIDLDKNGFSEGAELPCAIVFYELVAEVVRLAGEEFTCGK